MYRARKHWRAFAAATLLVACGPAAAPPPDPPSTPPPAEPAAEPPTAEWMTRVAAGEVPLAELIDPERGVIAAAYYTDPSEQDPRADDSGLVRFVERLCGKEARELGASLADDLERRLEGAEAPVFRCREWSCTHEAAAEYDLDGRYHFVARDGKLWLDRVIRIEGGPVTEEFVAEAEAWIERELPAAEATRCPGT